MVVFYTLRRFKRSLTEMCSSRDYMLSRSFRKKNKHGGFSVIAFYVVVISLKSLDIRTE